VAVVDPEVGTNRRALLAATARDTFIVPDNGLLSFLPPEEIRELRSIENGAYMLSSVSRTFHGRDVFAPAAGHLANGVPLEAFGPSVQDARRLALPSARWTPHGLEAQILLFDRFGNAVTSARGSEVVGCLRATLAGRSVPVGATYASVAPGEALALVGSSGRVELAVRNGNARAQLGLRPGDPVLFSA
jgi:S-adenosylmethionine hydrolase